MEVKVGMEMCVDALRFEKYQVGTRVGSDFTGITGLLFK